MSHLKHSGPIRRASALKRTALIEVYDSDDAANDPLTEQQRADAAMFTEEQLQAADRINNEGKAVRRADQDFCRAMDAELKKLGINDVIGRRS